MLNPIARRRQAKAGLETRTDNQAAPQRKPSRLDELLRQLDENLAILD